MAARRLFWFGAFAQIGNPYTHWFFDEQSGDIKPFQESPFAIRDYSSVSTLQKQEEEFDEIKKLKKVLIAEKHILTEAEEEVDLESKHYEYDEDCRQANYKLPDYNLNVSTVFQPTHDGIDTTPYYSSCTECPECNTKADYESFNAETSRSLMPYCSIIVDAPSATEFNQLEGLAKAESFPDHKEVALTEVIFWLGNDEHDFPERSPDHQSPYKSGDSVDNMGHCITIGLSRKSQNWKLFNLAAIYWRIQGNAFEAIECSKRAFHYSPPKYKDIPLLNMANVLHKHGYTKNATSLLKKALTYRTDKSAAIHHFTLGNFYATLEDYTEAINHYQKSLEHQPKFDDSQQRLFAVLCQAKLHHKLEQQHEKLKKTLEELRKFKEKQDQYKVRVDRLQSRYEDTKIQLQNHRIFQLDRQPPVDRGEVPTTHKDFKTCPVTAAKPHIPKTINESIGLEPGNSKGVEKPRRRGEKPSPITYPNRVSFFSLNARNTLLEYHYDRTDQCGACTPRPDIYDKSWPELKNCDEHVRRLPEEKDYPSIYLDPETRGFKVKYLLSHYLSIPDMVGSDHPWRQPRCMEWFDIETEITNPKGEFGYKNDFNELKELYEWINEFEPIKNRRVNNFVRSDEYLLRPLVNHVNKGRIWADDIGERVNLAYEKAVKKDPDNLWLIYNIAGLYWRVNGSNLQALECIIRGFLHAPAEHRDILLHQIASILFRAGGSINREASIDVLRKSLKINDKEPLSYYTMGHNLVARGNLTGAVEFYSYAYSLNPVIQESYQCLFVTKCGLKRQENGLPLSDPNVPEGDDAAFWEKSWRIQPDWWVRNHMRPYANKLAELKKMKLGEIAPLEEDQIAIDDYLRYTYGMKGPQQKTKEKGVNESEQERAYRIERRHRKFGKLAEALSKSVGHPVKYAGFSPDLTPSELSLEHIEVIFEGIDDELNAKKSYEENPYLEETPLNDEDEETLAEFSPDDKLKFKIAKTFILQLHKVNQESETDL